MNRHGRVTGFAISWHGLAIRPALRGRLPRDDVELVLAGLLAEALEPVAPDVHAAHRAADVRRRYFDRRTHRISLADCFVVATARPGDRVATGDRVLLDVARAEGLAVVDLEVGRG